LPNPLCILGRKRGETATVLDVVTRFEEAFADWLSVGRAFAFWKGRVALYAILRVMGPPQ
jgi:dTDP-4-amino-4,6-dideoxygalactose transaminase